MKKILMLMMLSPIAYAGGEDQPVPPALPPASQTPAATTTATQTTQTTKTPSSGAVTTTTTTTLSPSPASDNASCVGSKIVCQCTAPTPKVATKTITNTIKVPRKCPVVEPAKCPAAPPPKVEEKIVKVSDPNDYTRHSFSLMLGKGPQGVDLQLYGGQYQAWQQYGFTAGAMYEYNFAKNWAAGIGGFSNETYFGVLTFRK